jgi:hypothetical protein
MEKRQATFWCSFVENKLSNSFHKLNNKKWCFIFETEHLHKQQSYSSRNIYFALYNVNHRWCEVKPNGGSYTLIVGETDMG